MLLGTRSGHCVCHGRMVSGFLTIKSAGVLDSRDPSVSFERMRKLVLLTFSEANLGKSQGKTLVLILSLEGCQHRKRKEGTWERFKGDDVN